MRYQSPNLPEIRHLLSGLQEGAGTHRAPGKLRTRSSEERAELRQIFLARALDKQHAAAYNQEMQVELHSRKERKAVHFLILLIHIKLLLLILILQHLFG